MTDGKTSGRKLARPLPGSESDDVGEAIGLIVRHFIGNAPGSLGGQMPGIMTELRAALAPLQALRPDYGELTRDQAIMLRQVQFANERADLSKAAPKDRPRANPGTRAAAKGERT